MGLLPTPGDLGTEGLGKTKDKGTPEENRGSHPKDFHFYI